MLPVPVSAPRHPPISGRGGELELSLSNANPSGADSEAVSAATGVADSNHPAARASNPGPGGDRELTREFRANRTG